MKYVNFENYAKANAPLYLTVSPGDFKICGDPSPGENHKGGIDILTNQYDFTGKVLCNYLVQNNGEAEGNQQVTTKTLMTYDHAGRMLDISKTYNDDPKSTVFLERNTYDDMGQLRIKQLGQKRDEQTHAYETASVETM